MRPGARTSTQVSRVGDRDPAASQGLHQRQQESGAGGRFLTQAPLCGLQVSQLPQQVRATCCQCGNKSLFPLCFLQRKAANVSVLVFKVGEKIPISQVQTELSRSWNKTITVLFMENKQKFFF